MTTRMMITMLSLLAFGIATANAHAVLDHANPRVGNAVRTAPREVTLWFTQDLEPAFSTIEVRNASGARVDSGKATLASGDRKVLRVPVKSLAAGTYTVSWRVLSVDSHTTQGTFSFRVGE
jgi:copper resistance protein C